MPGIVETCVCNYIYIISRFLTLGVILNRTYRYRLSVHTILSIPHRLKSLYGMESIH